MYSLAIYLYMFCVNVVALFNKKARLLMRGHRNIYPILRANIRPDERYIWFHAASLGEFEQGRPLMEMIRKEHPEYKILLTFFSPSGYEVRKNYEGADVICYLPFDTALNARKFVRLARPEMAFFIKYEFWQNYLTVLYKKNIPAYSVSSIFRPNQIFFRKYARPYAHVLKCFAHFFVQNQQSYDLLTRHGIKNVTVVGDTRFDRVIQIRENAHPLPVVEAFAQSVPDGGQMVVAGSSWPADEDILIDYFNQHSNQWLVLAPHVVSEDHLQDIERKLKRPCIRYSQATTMNVAAAECLIIDGYGLLSSIYRYGQVAYVGGGFGVGIHNVPEAAVYGLPVVIGPNNKHFLEAQALLKLGGCFEIQDEASYALLMEHLASDRAFLQEAGQKAGAYINENAGAAEKVFKAVAL
ncbi:MAG: 3-deoxy-D-manno-octulosonic acid transferase [Bacteroidaceae bacterium]|nr:3-deoxy-D-manno-octulosonic acid transferase [Bacteroidaceae bacterium]